MLVNQDYETNYGTWEVDGKPVPVALTYRIAWRAMAATTGFRTFYPALIPPGSKHVHGVHSAGPIETVTHVFSGAAASSLLGDFYVRAAGIANLYGQVFESLPMPATLEEYNHVARTYLKLNCLTVEYAELWERITGTEWMPDTPILNALQRQRRKFGLMSLSLICCTFQRKNSA